MRTRIRARRQGRRLPTLLAGLILAAAATPVAVLMASDAGGSAAAGLAYPEPTAQTDASVPATRVTMIGSSPEEPGAPGPEETWGLGFDGATAVSVRYYGHGQEGTWTLGPSLPAGFEPAAGPLGGQMTRRGFAAVVGTLAHGEGVIVRKPDGGFQETATIPREGEELEGQEPLLSKEQRLSLPTRAPLLAPLEEEGGEAGALIVPESEKATVDGAVLHWDGQKWERETIMIPAKSSEDFRVIGIGASSPTNAWLLARLSNAYPSGAVALFKRREEGGHFVWKPVHLEGGLEEAEADPLTVPLAENAPAPFVVTGSAGAPVVKAQLLTVTSEGVWIDGARGDVEASAPATTTLFVRPEGGATGKLESSWCALPRGTPAGTPGCLHALPQALRLTLEPSRSIAWADGSRFGQRVITGLPEGVSLRLQGEEFVRVEALGGGNQPGAVPGALRGAAFTSPSEGWLGENSLPVHLTTSPAPSRLAPWPTAFRHPLLAAAAQPGAPVGSIASEALAVGEHGAVARYRPGQGWLPESLFGPGERVERPELRAVAWPLPNRAYAVGSGGEMWLWRGETGLWERDPATPLNFRDNLDGVAFDPSNPARGYAVGTTATGSGGVLLRYGKSWTPESALPPEVAGASFTGIAFAGSEAIVAYRIQPDPSLNVFVGGLLVNDGSGWHVDAEAAADIGKGVPQAVAGLPDGGAAFVVSSVARGQRLYERESAGAPWHLAPTPLPESQAGSLALFREAGQLRAIVTAGAVSVSNSAETPPGVPPVLNNPSGVSAGPSSGGVLRQTALGWSDDGHELNPAGSPEGGFNGQDLPYRPDPIFAVLIDPTGAQGWAIGGTPSGGGERLESGDISRYPADGAPAPGAEAATVTPEAGNAAFAFGGGAECETACSDREHAGVGPQAWLRAAVALAKRAGAAAFFDTGPTVTRGEHTGPRPPEIPFGRELGAVANILASQLGAGLPAYDAAAPPDLDARPIEAGSELSFETALSGLPAPLGKGSPAGGMEPVGARPAPCGAEVGCESAYYALLHTVAYTTAAGRVGTANVRVIVLDDSVHGDVDSSQRSWLAQQLGEAAQAGQPAIVVGNSNLFTLQSAHDEQAIRLIEVLGGPSPASAYFYDAPEENIQRTLVGGTFPVPTFGSGTLGYELASNEEKADFHGAKGILLGEVDLRPEDRPAQARQWPVKARLIPLVGELSLEAKGGVLLPRSRAVVFDGLARRPRAGCRAEAEESLCAEDDYVPIPAICTGGACASHEAILPEYEFTSSRPDIGGFVKENVLAGTSGTPQVLQNANGEPLHDGVVNTATGVEERAKSGLFCAYNKGETVVTIRAGGSASKLTVHVQAGSVRQPCGTVPLREHPAPGETTIPATEAPGEHPGAQGAPPTSVLPSIPVPAPPAAAPAVAAAQPPFVPLAALPAPLIPFVPPPVPTPARPTTPSGTSAVTSPVEAAEKEEEEEEATESVSNQAVAYRAHEHEPVPLYLLGVIVLAAFAGASIRRGPRGRRDVSVAPATVSSSRAQRELPTRRHRRRW